MAVGLELNFRKSPNPPLVEVWEVVEAEEGEAEAEDVQIAVETVEVVEVMEPEGVVDEGGRSTGRSKKRRRNI